MRRHGFTLVEAIIAIAIIAVLAAIATPRYASAMSNYRAELAARRLAADLALAQSSARSVSASRTVTLKPGVTNYAISGLTSLSSGGGPYVVTLSGSPFYAALGTVMFSDGNADNTLIYDGFGTPDSGVVVTVIAGGVTRTVTVDAVTGAVSVQ